MSALKTLNIKEFAFVTSLPLQVTQIRFTVTELMIKNLQLWKNSFLSLGFSYAFLLSV